MRLIHTSSTKPRNHYPTHTISSIYRNYVIWFQQANLYFIFLNYILCYNLYDTIMNSMLMCIKNKTNLETIKYNSFKVFIAFTEFQ